MAAAKSAYYLLLPFASKAATKRSKGQIPTTKRVYTRARPFHEYRRVYIRVRNRREWRIAANFHIFPRVEDGLGILEEGRERERERKKTRICASFEEKSRATRNHPSPLRASEFRGLQFRSVVLPPRVIIRFAGATFNQQPAYLPSASSSLAFDQTFRAVPRWKKYLSRSRTRPLPGDIPSVDQYRHSSRGFSRWTDRMNESAEEEEEGEGASSWFVGWQWKLNTVQLLLACPTGLCLLN